MVYIFSSASGILLKIVKYFIVPSNTFVFLGAVIQPLFCFHFQPFFSSEDESKILAFGHEMLLRSCWLALSAFSGLSVKRAMRVETLGVNCKKNPPSQQVVLSKHNSCDVIFTH